MNRIHIARQLREGTDKSPVPGALDYTYNPLKDPKLAAIKLKELLGLVEAARKLSRPELHKSVGGDLRAAALPLYGLWVQGARQSDKMWKGGGRQYSRSVQFVTL